MRNIIIDTDVGTDVDDLFALTYALRYSNNIVAIRTVHGDTEIRAKIAKKLQKILKTNVPIIAGSKTTLSGDSNYWCGFEKNILSKEEFEEPYKDNDQIKYTEDTVIVAIGPLTNIALDLKNNPEIKKVKEIYIMGSSKESHNLKVDPIATKMVLNHSWKKYFITKESAIQIVLTENELKTLAENSLGKFLYNSASRWLKYTSRTVTPMYDLLAVSAALGEGYISFKEEKGIFISDKVNPELKTRLLRAIKN